MVRISKLLAIAFFLWLVTLSLSYSWFPNLPGNDEKRVIELLVICSVLLWFILGGMKTVSICPSWGKIRYALYVLLSLAGISAMLAASPRHAVLEISLFAGLFYLGLFTAILWGEYRLRLTQWMVYAVLLGAVLYMVGFYVS